MYTSKENKTSEFTQFVVVVAGAFNISFLVRSGGHLFLFHFILFSFWLTMIL